MSGESHAHAHTHTHTRTTWPLWRGGGRLCRVTGRHWNYSWGLFYSERGRPVVLKGTHAQEVGYRGNSVEMKLAVKQWRVVRPHDKRRPVQTAIWEDAMGQNRKKGKNVVRPLKLSNLKCRYCCLVWLKFIFFCLVLTKVAFYSVEIYWFQLLLFHNLIIFSNKAKKTAWTTIVQPKTCGCTID